MGNVLDEMSAIGEAARGLVKLYQDIQGQITSLKESDKFISRLHSDYVNHIYKIVGGLEKTIEAQHNRIVELEKAKQGPSPGLNQRLSELEAALEAVKAGVMKTLLNEAQILEKADLAQNRRIDVLSCRIAALEDAHKELGNTIFNDMQDTAGRLNALEAKQIPDIASLNQRLDELERARAIDRQCIVNLERLAASTAGQVAGLKRGLGWPV
jgi:hypothetical protein